MKIVLTYVAYDGIEFDNERECREYEQYAFDMSNQILEYVHFYDAMMKEYPKPCAMFVEENLELLEEIYTNCYYIKIPKEIPSSAWIWFDNYFGGIVNSITLPEETGFFKYNFTTGWVKVDE